MTNSDPKGDEKRLAVLLALYKRDTEQGTPWEGGFATPTRMLEFAAWCAEALPVALDRIIELESELKEAETDAFFGR